MVKITGKSRKKYKLSITNVEAELNFIIPKTIPLILYPRKFLSVVPYPLNYLSAYTLSLKPLTGPPYSVNGELCSTKKPSAITFVEDDKKLRIKVSSVTEFTVWC